MLLRILRDYGDTYTLATLMGPQFITANPEGIKTLLTADPDTYTVALTELFDVFPGQGEGSLFKMTGESHRAARKLLAPPFHGARMRAYGALMRDIALRWARKWQPGRPFSMQETTQGITLDVIIQAIYGVSGEQQVEHFHAQVVKTVAAFVPSILILKGLRRNFFGLGPWARFQHRLAELQRLTLDQILEHRQSPQGREDILSLLLQARYEDGRALTETELFSQLFTFVFAGHETTAISLAWAFYFLHRDPAVLGRLRQELAPHRDSLDPDAIAKLPYLDAVCSETLRLRPVLPIVSRRLAKPLTVMGYKLPAGMMLGMGAFQAHMRPEVYSEPEAFRPERFLSRTYTPFEYLPFGGGARRCLGAAFALYEMKIVLAAIVCTYELKLASSRPVAAQLRAATVGPRGGVPMMLS
jgi:cytochrome P450